MKTFLILIALTNILFAKIEVAASYDYIADLVKNIAKDRVNVTVLGNPKMDPHFVVAKPSLISRLKNADVLIINGAQLEIGWIPQLVKSANNKKILAQGHFLDLSNYVKLIDVQQNVSRAQGDVHPDGNPHFILDPHNVLPIIDAITQTLQYVDNSNSDFYAKNSQEYKEEFKQHLQIWDEKMKEPKYSEVISFHRLYDYFLRRYDIELSGTLEPIPGVTPTAKHIMKIIKLIENKEAQAILQDVYNSKKESDYIASKTGIKVVVLPNDVNSLDSDDTLIKMYDDIVNKMSR